MFLISGHLISTIELRDFRDTIRRSTEKFVLWVLHDTKLVHFANLGILAFEYLARFVLVFLTVFVASFPVNFSPSYTSLR